MEATGPDGSLQRFAARVSGQTAATLELTLQDGTGGEPSLAEGSEVILRSDIEGQPLAAMVTVVQQGLGQPPRLVTTSPERTERVSRRRHFRVDVDLPFVAGNASGHVANLSGGGLLVGLSSGTLQEGDNIAFTLRVPGSGDIAVQGRVARLDDGARHRQAGIQFTNLADGMRRAIVGHLKQRRSDPAPEISPHGPRS